GARDLPAGPVDGGEDDAQIAAGFEHGGVENQRFEPGEVRGVDLFVHLAHRAACRRVHGGVGVAGDGVDLADDAARVRFDHLRAVVEVDLEAVVMRRVVARGNHDPRVRTGVADGEGKL